MFKFSATSSVVALLTLLAPGALPASATTVPSALEIQLEVGHPGTAHAGQWIPVTTTIRNRGPAFPGTLQLATQWITHESSAVRIGPYRAVPQAPSVYRLPVDLPPQTTTRHILPLLANGDLVRADLLDARDRSVATGQATLYVGAVAPVVAVISDREGALDQLRRVHPPGALSEIQVVRFRPEEAPNSAVLLRAFDIVAIDGATAAPFSRALRTALLDYVEVGGSLLVAAGANGRKTASGLPPQLLPASIGDGSDAEEMRGQGRLLFTSADSDSAERLGQVVARLLPAQPAVAGMGSHFGHPLLERSQRIDRLLPRVWAPRIPPPGLLGLLLLAYVLLLGPLHYVLLRRVGRRHLAWVTLPAIAIVVTAAAYGLALRNKGPEILANRFRVVHLEDGWERAYVETYAGIFVPRSGTYTVRLPGDPYVATLVGGSYGAVVGGRQQSGGRSPVDLQLLDVSPWSLRGFSTEEFIRAPGALEPRLLLRDGRLVGTITNRLPFALTDAVAVAGSTQTLGRVGPGQSVAVNLPTRSAGGPPGSRTFGSPPRSQLLQAVFPNLTSDAPPVFIAWATPAAAAPLRVNGPRAGVRDLDLFILPLRPVSP